MVGVFATTLNVVAAVDEPVKLWSPEYFAVTECDPSANALVNSASPSAFTTAVLSAVVPSEKTTLPVGRDPAPEVVPVAFALSAATAP